MATINIPGNNKRRNCSWSGCWMFNSRRRWIVGLCFFYYCNSRIQKVSSSSSPSTSTSTTSFESRSKSSRPNFVILFADNLAYHDISCFRNRNDDDDSSTPTTPNVDRLALEGMKFTHWNSAAALCSASRAALLTSKYPVRTGVYPRVFKPDAKYGLMPNETTIAEYLQRVGYATKIVGKWHLGHRRDYLPTNQGFESWTGIPYHMSGGSVDNHICQYDQHENMWLPLYNNETIVEQPVQLQSLKDVYSNESIQFIKDNVVEHNNTPFFLYMAFSHVHQLCAPRDSPEQETCQWAATNADGDGGNGVNGASFHDAVQEMDEITGRILDALDMYNVTNDTVVLFTSDNGPWVAEQSCAGQKGIFQGEWLKHHVSQDCTACPHDYVPSPTIDRPRRCVLKRFDHQQQHQQPKDKGQERPHYDDHQEQQQQQTMIETRNLTTATADADDEVVWDLDGVHCGEDTGLGGVWEANLRMPAIVRYPRRIERGTVSHDLVSTLDVLPTFLSTIGHPIPDDIDGIDISNILYRTNNQESDTTNNDNSTRTLFFWRDGFEDGPLPPPFGRFDVAAVKRGYIKAWFWTKSAHYNNDKEQYHNPPLLFDVSVDPGESTPLDPHAYEDVIEEIFEATKRHKQTIGWGEPLALATDPRYIPCVNRSTGCRTT